MSDYQRIIEENYTLKYQVNKYLEKIERLSKIIDKKEESNEKMFKKYTQRGREIKRLKARIEWLETKLEIPDIDGAKELNQ